MRLKALVLAVVIHGLLVGCHSSSNPTPKKGAATCLALQQRTSLTKILC